MRINKFIAAATGLSRRASDGLLASGKVLVNGTTAKIGQDVSSADKIMLDGKLITLHSTQTILLNKPPGYVVSRNGQGSKTVYDLLPEGLRHLKPIGRLDKDSRGLLLLTNDGELTQNLSHPSSVKQKIYEVKLDKKLNPEHRQQIIAGVKLDDGISKLSLEPMDDNGNTWRVTMHEGRNRQIRRTFSALGYNVTDLNRTHFGKYELSELTSGKFEKIEV